jgi:hypothetical protein
MINAIIAYAYEAALHCPDCTRKRHQRTPFQYPAEDCGPGDEHGIPWRAVDREGNRVHPVFSTSSDADGEYCDDCCAELAP